ncbi:hypothetical protein [Bosea sp. 2RAB26]|uniref:hypothetical protein n=1 Tax=Bosea sp. 2RAB26 TaxID=3237476 RepID=UPI003F90771C
MGATATGARWGRGIVAVLCAYALILNAVLMSIGAGLSAAPSPFPRHVLCAPGGSSEPTAPASPEQSKTCCALGCLAGSSGAPPVAAAALPLRRSISVARDVTYPPAPRIDSGRSVYPLGARAPPALA